MSDLLVTGKSKAAKENKTFEVLFSVTASRSAVHSVMLQATQTASSYYALGEIGYGRPAPDFSDEKMAKRVDETIQKDTAGAFKFRPVLDDDKENKIRTDTQPL